MIAGAVVRLISNPSRLRPRKDLDPGLDAGRRFEVPMPLAAATRDLVHSMIGRGWTGQDFATLLLQQAQASGLALQPEDVRVEDGLS